MMKYDDKTYGDRFGMLLWNMMFFSLMDKDSLRHAIEMGWPSRNVYLNNNNVFKKEMGWFVYLNNNHSYLY